MHDFDVTLVGRSYVEVMVTVLASPNLVDNISLDHLIHFMLSLHVHYLALPLSVIICHLLIIMICFKGMCLIV